MPRLPHGVPITREEFRNARDNLADRAAETPLGFAVAQPVDTRDFGYLFPELQDDPANLLPEARETRDALVDLGRAMADDGPAGGGADSGIPAAYTYFGQFVDHDVTLETHSAPTSQLVRPDMAPHPPDRISQELHNLRTAALELDSVYGLPAPRGPEDRRKMRVGKVTELGGSAAPLLRPPGKKDRNDLPREPRNADVVNDRAALIGDPRNDENTIIAQLHTAFLLAHNRLVEDGNSFRKARRILRQHYQHVVLHDFLKRIVDPRVVDETIGQNRVFDAEDEDFFMPLEFSVAAYRFGHSMVRAAYDFNLNFNTSGAPGTTPATLGFLFTFTALSGQLGEDIGLPESDTLPENWIIEWENLVEAGSPPNMARRLDTKLVEPLAQLRGMTGSPEQGLGKSLAVRNLLRGYLLRMPTGQAVARALEQRLSGVRDIPTLTRQQIREGAASQEQVEVLRDAGFLERTPLWYYVLAEASVLGDGRRLGPVGGTIVAEVLVGLVRRSPNSILGTSGWQPTLPGERSDEFALPDLLRFAGVLG